MYCTPLDEAVQKTKDMGHFLNSEEVSFFQNSSIFWDCFLFTLFRINSASRLAKNVLRKPVELEKILLT